MTNWEITTQIVLPFVGIFLTILSPLFFVVFVDWISSKYGE